VSFDYRVIPMPEPWPGKPTPEWKRSRAPFKGTPGKALKLLAREIRMLNGKNVRIAIDVRPDQIRLDGQLYASARARSPGVVVLFDVSDGTLQFPCDRFLYWESNVDAVARALEALRMVDRYGVQQGKQYTGFKQIPASTGTTMDTREAATVIASGQESFSAADVLRDRIVARDAVRIARARTHPDAGGSPETFHRIGIAANVLAAHHGVSSL